MNDRRKALLEIRSFLEEEGWAPIETQEFHQGNTPPSKAIFRANPILTVICLTAVATNFILLGTNHDLRSSREMTLSIRSLRISGSEMALNSFKKDPKRLFMTVDGERIWGPDQAPSLDFSAWEDLTRLPPVPYDTRSILQLWERDGTGMPTLIGQAIISSDHPEGSSEEVHVKDLKNQDIQYLIKLQFGRRRGPTLATSEQTSRN